MGLRIDRALYSNPSSTSDKPLGARLPSDKPYVDKYPLTIVPTVPQVPIVLGINWYTDFDKPVLVNGRYWIGLNSKSLGTIRGGHCVCIKSPNYSDSTTWWVFYNQGMEGACVGFGSTRMMTLLNRKRYDARWLWDWAKSKDPWKDTNPGDDNGTSVDAAMQILASMGHVPWKASYTGASWQQRDKEVPVASEGITSYHWATKVDQVRSVLQAPLNDTLQAVPILNSWGKDFPHITWMPYTTLQRVMDEDGEVALVTDRVPAPAPTLSEKLRGHI